VWETTADAISLMEMGNSPPADERIVSEGGTIVVCARTREDGRVG
jgi:hypothetical protein